MEYFYEVQKLYALLEKLQILGWDIKPMTVSGLNK